MRTTRGSCTPSCTRTPTPGYARTPGRGCPSRSAQGSPHWPGEEAPSAADAAVFAVTELATGELAGEALLWGIDLHNRSAHVGLALRPASRGRGLGGDAVRVLCHYGFAIRGLHRLQLETLPDNHAMMAAAVRAGFTREGTTGARRG